MPLRVLARRPALAAGILAAGLGAAFVAAFGPRYATNDDPLMAMLAAGTGFAPAPDEHLVFTNVLVGLALRAFHRGWPGAPWYALYLLAAQLVAAAAVLFVALRASAPGVRLALAAVFLAVAAVPFANNLHFTIAALVAAQAGVLMALSGLERPLGRGAAAAAAALVVLGALVRFEAFLLALALALLPALCAGWRRERPAVLSAAGPLAAGAALALGAYAFDAAYYQRQPAWAAYREFNRLLRPFVDFDRAADYTPQTASAFRAAGWSRNDHRLLLEWFHADAQVFSPDNLRTVLAQAPPAPLRPRERLHIGFRRVGTNRVALPILLAMPLALAAAWPSARSRGAVLAAFGSSVAVLAVLLVFRKAPPHVYLPVLAWPLAVAVAAGVSARRGPAARVALVLAAVLAAAGAARALSFQRMESREGSAREAELTRALAPLGSVAPDRFYVLWATFPYHAGAPLAPAWPGLRFVALGWPLRTPAGQGGLAALGHRDLIEALADPRARLVAPYDAAGWIAQYARRHRGLALELVQEATVAEFSVLRAVVGPAAGAPAERVLRSSPAGPE